MQPTVCYKAFPFLYTTDPICLSTYLMELWHEGEKQTEKWKKISQSYFQLVQNMKY